MSQYPGINFILLCILIITFFYAIFFKKCPLKIYKYDIFLFTIFIYVLLISWIADFGGIFSLIAVMTTIASIRLMINSKILSITEVVLAFCVMFVFSGLVGLKEQTYGLSYGAESVSRFLSSYGDPNFYALIGAASIVSVNYITDLSKTSKLTLSFLLGILTLITFSKSLIFLLLVNLIYLYFNSKTNTVRYFKSVFLIFFVFLLATYTMTTFFGIDVFHNYMFRFLEESNSSGASDTLTTGRYYIQTVFLTYFWDQDLMQMIFGNGYIGSIANLSKTKLSVVSAHSVYIQMLVDFGIFGTLFFSIILLLGYTKASQSVKPILLTYMAAFVALSWQFSIANILFYILLGLKVENPVLPTKTGIFNKA